MQKQLRPLFAALMLTALGTTVPSAAGLPRGDKHQLRRAVFRAVYGEAGLNRYAVQAIPAIHIIVKNGNVALEGVVDSEMDSNLANLRANQVPNVFSVKNNLVVAGNSKKRA